MLSSTKQAIMSDVKRMSYQLVADRYGLTRNQVAGIVWREKNPHDTLIFKTTKGKRCGGRCGRGRRGPGPIPAKTAQNTR